MNEVKIRQKQALEALKALRRCLNEAQFYSSLAATIATTGDLLDCGQAVMELNGDLVDLQGRATDEIKHVRRELYGPGEVADE